MSHSVASPVYLFPSVESLGLLSLYWSSYIISALLIIGPAITNLNPAAGYIYGFGLLFVSLIGNLLKNSFKYHSRAFDLSINGDNIETTARRPWTCNAFSFFPGNPLYSAPSNTGTWTGYSLVYILMSYLNSKHHVMYQTEFITTMMFIFVSGATSMYIDNLYLCTSKLAGGWGDHMLGVLFGIVGGGFYHWFAGKVSSEKSFFFNQNKLNPGGNKDSKCKGGAPVLCETIEVPEE